MFGLLGKKGRSEIGAVAGFGKIPALGDFVRTPSPSEEMIAFEAWLTRAMEAGETRAGAAFKDAFSAGAPYAFLWCGAIDKKQRGVLAGVLLPSRDAVGRRFPVIVCAPLPLAALAVHPHVAPLVLYDFFYYAVSAASRAAQTASQAEFHAQVVSIGPPSLDAMNTSLTRYGAWAKAHRAVDMWTALFGEAADRSSRYALNLVVEATSTYRGQDTPPLSLGVRVPLGADTAITAAMWIDLVRHSACWKTTVPSLFLPLPGGPPSAIIQLGAEAPPSVLTDLYAPSPDSSALCDVTPNHEARFPSTLSPAVSRALGATDAVLADVFLELARA